MIKKCLLISVISFHSYACTGGMGILNLENQNLDCIFNIGTVSLDFVKVKHSVNVTGTFHSSNSVVGKLKIIGTTNLDNTAVEGNSEIMGTTIIDKSNVYSLSIHGNTEIKDSNIKNVNIIGNITSNNSTLLNQLNITGKYIKLNNTIINGDIQVSLNSTVPQKQYMIINGGRVNGNIIFKSGMGIVTLINLPRIKGEIIGAVINDHN